VKWQKQKWTVEVTAGVKVVERHFRIYHAANFI
jgi:hypothetical protein